MTVSVTHKFASAKANGTDVTQVQPSNWNDTHAFTCAANSVLGNSTGTPGNVAEVPTGTLGQSLLAANVLADLIAAGVPVFTTGDVKFTLKTSADTGWIMCNDQTIGPTGSSATFANNSAQALYTLIWTNVSNSFAPVTGGRGVSAAADWTAAKPLQLTLMMGCALGVSGAGSGLTSRSLGQSVGEETHLLTTAQIPTGLHTLVDPGHHHQTTAVASISASAIIGNPGGNVPNAPTAITSTSVATGITLTDNAGGGVHNNMQPTTFLNAMMKL
jgi:microcystin-dependent protein